MVIAASDTETYTEVSVVRGFLAWKHVGRTGILSTPSSHRVNRSTGACLRCVCYSVLRCVRHI